MNPLDHRLIHKHLLTTALLGYIIRLSRIMTAPSFFSAHKTTPLTASIHVVLWAGLMPIMAAANTTDTTAESLNRLSEHYHKKPSIDARCHGVWVQPQRVSLANELNHQETTINKQDGLFAQADYGYWDNQDYAELSGNVIIEQNGQQVTAQKITYHPSTGQAIAQGQVLFSDGIDRSDTADSQPSGVGIIGVAQKLHYQQDGIAQAHDVAFASTTLGAHGHARHLQKVDNQHYQMQDVMFSTCPPTERKWHLQAQSIDINTDTGRGIAKKSTLKLGDVPVLHLPYFNFPIDDRRSSGFLLPQIGFGSDSFEIDTPYYFNLAPNYDATITPTIFTNKNPMFTGELRYLTNHYGSGVLTASLLPSDRKYNHEHRSRVFFDHEWRAKQLKHLSAYATYRYVSDRDYLSDFDNLGLQNNPLNLPRRIGASYYNDHIFADLRAETFQTLKGTNNDGTPISDKDKPYSRLPQLSAVYHLPKFNTQPLNNLQITGVHNSAYFKKSIKDNSEAEKSGVRMYNQILASYPIVKPWGYVTPKLGLTHLYASYDEDSLTGNNLSKEEGSDFIIAPQIILDMGVFFEKTGSPFGWHKQNLGGHQLISPRLKYHYTPYKNQSKIPNFETAIAAISYDQLLSDSWFLGYDRIQDLHAITPALHYRYTDKNGVARLEAGVAEQIFIDSPKVGINNSQEFTGRSSGMAWQASIQPTNDFWLHAAGAFTPNYDLNSIVTQLRYQPNEKSLYNFGIIQRKENKATNQLPLSAYTASAIFAINNRWRLLSQAQYDYKNHRLLDALVGINYEDCCYGISIYARRYRNDLTPHTGTNNAIMAEIRLNGISSGGKLDRLLSDKVMGYDNAQNAWQQSY